MELSRTRENVALISNFSYLQYIHEQFVFPSWALRKLFVHSCPAAGCPLMMSERGGDVLPDLQQLPRGARVNEVEFY